MSSGGSKAHKHILIGLVLGAVAGLVANIALADSESGREALGWFIDGVAYPIGQVFLRLLFLVVLPLVFASLASGVAGLGDLSKLGRLGGRTLLFFLGMSLCAAVIGIAAMDLIQPGSGFDQEVQQQLMADFGADAAGFAERSAAAHPEGLQARVTVILDAFVPRNLLRAVVDMQMVPLIVFALLVGAALTRVRVDRRDAVLAVLDGTSEAMVGIVGFAMKLAAPAVFCLVFGVVARFGLDLLQRLGLFVAVVLACYLVQLLVVYPAVLRSLARRPPIAYLKGAIPVVITAFSTSSSAATLPESIRVAESSLGIRPRVAGFVLPLGATMNMNGTALFEGCVVLFVAQVFGVDLSIPEQGLVVALCVLTSVGAAGVPGGSIPLLMVVMSQVGVPPEGIALVLGVDRLLDMGRTVVNVGGDLVACAYIEAVEAKAEGA
ncbi:MAG: cation:dicarboxylase symporter family transporter [Planctomycetaceae bacterium]|nr:cation:dicarboxylase symporter family transporter [Planctomycetaceae bacterium]